MSKCFIGVDDGHYAIKICDGIKCFYLPSRVVYGKKQIMGLTGDILEDNCYIVDGSTLTIAEDIIHSGDIIDTRFINYPTSDVNAALICHGLYRANVLGEINIVTGLPYADFFEEGKKNNKLIKAKENNLNRNIANLNKNVSLPIIKQHKVISEGIGGYFDLLFDMNGNQNENIVNIINNQSLAITDIGGKTTEIIQIAMGGQGIVTDRSATINIGILDLINSVSNKIKNLLKLDNIISERIEAAIESNIYKAFGKDHDVADIISEEKMIFARKINDEHRKVLKDASEIGLHAIIGGGSLHIKTELKKTIGGTALFVNEPQFSNARGNYKAAKYVLKWGS